MQRLCPQLTGGGWFHMKIMLGVFSLSLSKPTIFCNWNFRVIVRKSMYVYCIFVHGFCMWEDTFCHLLIFLYLCLFYYHDPKKTNKRRKKKKIQTMEEDTQVLSIKTNKQARLRP